MISATRNTSISTHCRTLTNYFSKELQEYYFIHLLIANIEEDTKLRLTEFSTTSESQKERKEGERAEGRLRRTLRVETP